MAADDGARTESPVPSSPAPSSSAYSASPAANSAVPPPPPLAAAVAEVQARSSRHGAQYAFPDHLLRSVKLKYVRLGYHYLMQQALYLLLIPLGVAMAAEMGSRARHKGVAALWESSQQYKHLAAAVATAMAAVASVYYVMSRPKAVYMLDFACYRPGKGEVCSNAEFLRYTRATKAFSERSVELQRKVCERSGLGEETSLPPAVMSEPPNPCMGEARREAERVMFAAIDALLVATSVHPKDIGVLVVNCSLFVPTPSLASLIVSRYSLRGNVKSFNLAGMGCSAGVIAIDLAARLLRSSSSSSSSSGSSSSDPSLALVVSMENITLNWYLGNDPSKLVSNCIFRMGGAAILLSSRPSDRTSAKYELVHTVRTHKGADDKAYRCVYQEEDDDQEGHRHSHGHGKVGVSLSKELMAIAGNALKANITTLGPLVLPLSEQILFFASLILRKLAASGYGYGYGDGGAKMKPYIPDFKRAFEHFCIHAGGRAVLDELEKNLGLSEWHMEPSRMTLYRFGNTSSSSLWYELAYTEAKGRVKKGDRLWQIAFGSGFKCNSAVWRALSAIAPTTEASINNPWSDIIHKFPVAVPTIRTLSSPSPSPS